jgi:glycosyltransferase involved in cell wall biosynthesis
MIRVGVVCDHLELGGQELATLELLRGLDRARFDPLVYAFRPGRLLPEVRALGVPVVVGHDRPGGDPRWTASDRAARLAFRRRLADALRADTIDVCLVFAWPDGIAAAREAGVRAIVERVDGPGLTSRVRDKSSCDWIICESHAVRRLLLAQRELFGCDPRRITVIQNGVDTGHFDPSRYDRDRCRRALGLGPGDFAIGAVARLAPQKNLGLLLDALALLVRRHPRVRPRVRTLIVGPDAGSGAQLRARARALGIDDRVRFLGPRADIPEILRALDTYVVVSLFEGTSRALLEAMAMGLPAVATELPALAELVDGNGYLVGLLDPHQVYLALRDLLHHPALRSRLGRRSRQLALRHDVGPMIRGYEDVLRRALRASRPVSAIRGRLALVEAPSRRSGRKGAGPLAPLYEHFRDAGVDVCLLRRRPAVSTRVGSPIQPGNWVITPGRLGVTRGHLGRLLEWIQPDLAIVTSGTMTVRLRQALPSARLLFWAPSVDARPPAVPRTAARVADRILVATEACRRRYARDHPEWKKKLGPVLLRPDVRHPIPALRAALGNGRPATR